MKIMTKSYLTYFAIIVLMLAGNILWNAVGFDHPIINQPTSSFIVMIAAGLAGFIALLLSSRAGIPSIWEAGISNANRAGLPAAMGAGFGVVEIIILTFIIKVPNIHAPLPIAVPVYFSLGILTEILFHFIPIILLLWFFSNVLLKGRGELPVFITLILVLSLIEPTLQATQIYRMGMIVEALPLILIFIFVFIGNIIPLYLLKKAGLLAMIIWRLSDYLVWHIIWPAVYF